MAITLHAQALITVDEAARYLQDQGVPSDNYDLLKIHINGITGVMLGVMGRNHFKWIDGDQITETVRGHGDNGVYVANSPIVSLDQVILNPFDTSPTVLTGPGESDSNSDMWFDAATGLVTLKNYTFPDVPVAAKVLYEAGYQEADHQYQSLRLIALNALASKWKRWKDQKHGVASESKGETSVSYATTDFNDVELAEMRRHKRRVFG